MAIGKTCTENQVVSDGAVKTNHHATGVEFITLAMDILVDMPKVAGHVHPQAPLDRKIVPAGSLSVVEAVFQMLTDRSTRGAIGLNNGIHDVGVNLTRNLLSRDEIGRAHV